MRRLKPLRIALYAGITLLWLISMTALIERHYGRNTLTASDFSTGEAITQEQWMGIYQQGSKIGYSVRRLLKETDGYMAFESVFMRLKVMGVEKDIRITTEATLDNAMKLRAFNFNLESDVDMRVEGSVTGKSLLVKLSVGDTKTEQRVQLKEEPYMPLSLQPQMLSNVIKDGRAIRLPVIEPSTLTEDVIELRLAGKESLMGIEAFKLDGSFKGMDFTMWVDEKGEVIKEDSMGFTSIREKKEDAMKVISPSVDLIVQVSIPFDMKLPEDVSYLKVRLKGIDPAGFELDGGSQRLKGDVLEVSQQSMTALKTTPIKPAQMEEYLKETLFVQSKDPAVVELAKEIVGEGAPGDAKETLRRARLIYEWVYKNITKTPALTIPTAVEVIRSRRGDCNEHTTLYVALARASGIPSRAAIGLVHKKGSFYYHAWPEVYLGGWVPIDPTLGQFPADATHIRLLTGDIDKQGKLISVIGKLKLEGIEFK